MSETLIALVERSYRDPDNYLNWDPVAVFPDFDQAFTWCRAKQGTSVILLEKPRVIGWTKSLEEPVLANFVDQEGVCGLVKWSTCTPMISSVEISWPGRNPLYHEDILRIRLRPFGPLKKAEEHYEKTE